MIRKNTILVAMSLAMLTVGCLEPYDPPITDDEVDFIVVSGFIDIGQGSAEVTINHSIPLHQSGSPSPELFADVKIKDDAGNIFQLNEIGNGRYMASGMAVDYARQYQLYFRTDENREYQSEFITVKPTPPIDSVTYQVEGDELNIFVNAHDDTGNSRYYRWKYIETYEYVSPKYSRYVIINGEPLPRTPEQQIYRCWRTDTLSQIMVGTTSLQSADVVSKYQVRTLGRSTRMVSEEYSILVRQQAITAEEYTYLLNLEKATETLGGLFDPMPSEVKGNMSSLTDANETVIGYFSGGSITEKRIFFTREELPDNFGVFDQPFCDEDTVAVSQVRFQPNPNSLIAAIIPPGSFTIIGYTTAEPLCIDCRLIAGGSTFKPPFWP